MTAGPAAGTGGTSRKRTPAKGSRAEKLTRARAAGAAGHPAPPWIDDAELLDAYDQGASSLGSSWAGDTDSATPSDDNADDSEPPAEPPTPTPAPSTSGKRRKGRTVGPVRATGTQGDAAGLFLGILAAAFVTNVLHGTWTDWLKAKFLNQVTGKLPSGFNAPPTVTTGPNGSVQVGPSSPGGLPGAGIQQTPGGTVLVQPGET